MTMTSPCDSADITDPSAEASMPGSITTLVRRWSSGDRLALDELVPLVYDELELLAGAHMRSERSEHTLPRTALIHEAYLRLARQKTMDMESRAQFFALASSTMRHVLIDHARSRSAAKRGGGQETQSLDASGADGTNLAQMASDEDAADLLTLNEALERLEDLDPQQSRVVEMRFFLGMSVEQTAEALQVSERTVKREWSTARAWLLRELGRARQRENGDG